VTHIDSPVTAQAAGHVVSTSPGGGLEGSTVANCNKAVVVELAATSCTIDHRMWTRWTLQIYIVRIN